MDDIFYFLHYFRDSNQKINEHLLNILSDTVKANMDTEQNINKKLTLLTGQGRRSASTPTNENPPDAAEGKGQGHMQIFSFPFSDIFLAVFN